MNLAIRAMRVGLFGMKSTITDTAYPIKFVYVKSIFSQLFHYNAFILIILYRAYKLELPPLIRFRWERNILYSQWYFLCIQHQAKSTILIFLRSEYSRRKKVIIITADNLSCRRQFINSHSMDHVWPTGHHLKWPMKSRGAWWRTGN